MTRFTIGTFFVLASFTTFAFAQNKEARQRKLSLDLGDVVFVEPTKADQPSVLVLTTRLQDERRTTTIPVTNLRAETRTRTVQVDGKSVEQTYTVQVPYTTRIEQAYTVQAKPSKVVQLAKVSGWDVNGNKFHKEELAIRLDAPCVAFLLRRPWPNGAVIDPAHLAVLREDLLFLHVPDLNAKQKE